MQAALAGVNDAISPARRGHSSDITKLVITTIGAAVTIAGLVVQIRKLLPEWHGADIAELKTVLELRKLVDSSEEEYHTLTAVIHKQMNSTLFAKKEPTSWEQQLLMGLFFALLAVLFLGIAIYFFTVHRVWLGATWIFLAIGAAATVVTGDLSGTQQRHSNQNQQPDETLKIDIAPVKSDKVITAISNAASGLTLAKDECELLQDWLKRGIFKVDYSPRRAE